MVSCYFRKFTIAAIITCRNYVYVYLLIDPLVVIDDIRWFSSLHWVATTLWPDGYTCHTMPSHATLSGVYLTPSVEQHFHNFIICSYQYMVILLFVCSGLLSLLKYVQYIRETHGAFNHTEQHLINLPILKSLFWFS